MKLLIALILGAMLLMPGPTAAENYPDRAVRLIVPFPPGGSNDISARIAAEKMSARWGKPVVVENKPGAGGNLGAALVSRMKPDGYSILVTSGAIAINPALYKDLGFELKGLTPVALLSTAPFVLAVNPKLVPATSTAEFIAYAKSKDGTLTWGTTTKGNPDHLSGELLQMMAGFKMKHIPYKGGSEALIDVLGDRVDIGFFAIPVVLPYLKSGQLRALGITDTKRSTLLPDVPTIAEAVPGFEMQNFYSAWVPTGVSSDVINAINDAFRDAIKKDDVQQRLLAMGFATADYTPKEFVEYVNRETAKFARVIEAIGLEKQ